MRTNGELLGERSGKEWRDTVFGGDGRVQLEEAEGEF